MAMEITPALIEMYKISFKGIRAELREIDPEGRLSRSIYVCSYTLEELEALDRVKAEISKAYIKFKADNPNVVVTEEEFASIYVIEGSKEEFRKIFSKTTSNNL